MKPASVNEIKKELQTRTPAQLLEFCLRLAKYKLDNKELLNYLLFEADDEEQYIRSIKDEVRVQFAEINVSHLYYAKKSIRKILRTINKYSKYSASKETTIELLIYFCTMMKESGISFRRNAALSNLYEAQLKKIVKTMETLHEDLQYDYQKQLNDLMH
jgi:hypothetical protein